MPPRNYGESLKLHGGYWLVYQLQDGVFATHIPNDRSIQTGDIGFRASSESQL